MSKTNDPLATRRLNNRPKASKVKVAKPVGVVSLGNARRQNLMEDGQLAQVPSDAEPRLHVERQTKQ